MLNNIKDIELMMWGVFEDAKNDILDRHDRAGQVASGKTARSLKAEVVSDASSVTGTMYGRKYFASLETGSQPWKKQYKHPPRPFVDTIQRWMDDKGIEGVSAYLVARKIMREGSQLYRQGGRDDIFTPAMSTIEATISEKVSSLFDTILTKTLVR